MFSDSGLQIGLAVAVAVAAAGFFVGTAAPVDDPSRLRIEASPFDGRVEVAPTYSELRTTSSTTSTWDAEAARWTPAPGDSDRSNRAYEGAPPTIPHAVDQASAGECMACHEDGLAIRGQSASAVPHDAFASCTQCHVVQDTPVPGEALAYELADNRFVGMAAPGDGARYWAGGPPLIPHTTRMRENCDSCHGPAGSDPLVTPHPERQSCSQCHAPSAELEGNAWD